MSKRGRMVQRVVRGRAGRYETLSDTCVTGVRRRKEWIHFHVIDWSPVPHGRSSPLSVVQVFKHLFAIKRRCL
jgi:hypothetical protein